MNYRYFQLDQSHEERSVYGRAPRAGEPGLTDEILEWRLSTDGGKRTVASSRKAALLARSKRHDVVGYCSRAISRLWRSPMLHIVVMAVVVGFSGLCVIYSYPLTGMVFLGTLAYYALALSERF